MAPRDLILNTSEAQRIALFFDRILIWGLEREEFSVNQRRQFEADLAYLREQGVALMCGVQIPHVMRGEKDIGEAFKLFEGKDLLFPLQACSGLAKEVGNEAHADRMVRHFSSQLMYDEAPVVAHATPSNFEVIGTEFNAIEIVLKNIPLPPTNLPWEDFVQFRKEEENIAKLRALRIWLQKRAGSKDKPRIMQEELEQLLYEYQEYMEIQHKKFSVGVLSTLISSTPEIAGHLVTLNLGSALKALFAVRGHSIELSSAELSAPGREVSYIAKAKKVISRT